MRAERANEAADLYTRAARSRPNDADIRNNLLIALNQAGRHAEAANHAEAWVRLEPASAPARFQHAYALEHSGEANRAIGQYTEAIRLDGRLNHARLRLGLVYKKRGRFEEAEAHLTGMANISPEDADVRLYLAQVLLSQGKMEGAIANLERALELRSDFWHVSLLLSLVLSTHDEAIWRNGARARELLAPLDRVAHGDGGGSPVILAAQAAAYAETGDFEQAIEQAEKGLALARKSEIQEYVVVFTEYLAAYHQGKPTRFRDWVDHRMVNPQRAQAKASRSTSSSDPELKK